MESHYIPYQAITTLPSGPVLVLAPHPDDEVFGCGGAILRHVAQGDTVTVLLATDGQAAIPHADSASRDAYVARRLAESQAAAQILGYRSLLTWGIPDRSLVCENAWIQRLVALIHSLNPDGSAVMRVYAPSLHEIHPDHYALAELAYHAVCRCGAAATLVMYEVGVPLRPNLLLDITALVARKQAAIDCFHSQLALQDYRRHMQALNAYRAYTLPACVTAAEGFYQLDGETLRQQPALRFGPSRQTEALAAAWAHLAERAPDARF
jgi:LmbE family N-acetylglucosaminyl deacetylase